MVRDDELVDSIEIDNQKQQQLEALTSVPEVFSADYLRIYYGKLFPYGDFFKWLCYGNDGKHPGCDQSYVGRREFSLTLENDIYLHFQSFYNATELESSIKEKCPFKIDIGPVYSPAKRHAYAQSGNDVFVPLERELIFDIDISDYDDVRYCCSGADVCLDCWPLMTIAIKILDTSLRDDFGFNHILWVYSGRRGVHCWVCDSRARKLSNEQMAAIAEYFQVYKGGENALKKVSLAGSVLHPFLARSYTDVLRSFFSDKLLLNQQLFASEERCQKILDLIPDENVASELHDKWQGNRRSSLSKEDVNATRWDQLKTTLQSGKHQAQGLRRCVAEIVFSYTYPRLDMEVSKHMNHLLKAPFCIHPKTGRVCVPIDPNNCDDFDLAAVPTLSQLLGELVFKRNLKSVSDYSHAPSGICVKPYHFMISKERLGKNVPKEIHQFLQSILSGTIAESMQGGTRECIQCKTPTVQEFLELVKHMHVSVSAMPISSPSQSISTGARMDLVLMD